MNGDFETLLENFDLSARLRQTPFDVNSSVSVDYRAGYVESPGFPEYATPRNLDTSFDGFDTADFSTLPRSKDKPLQHISVRIDHTKSINDDDSDSDSEPLITIAQPSATITMVKDSPTRIYSSRTRANVRNALLDDSYSDVDEIEDENSLQQNKSGVVKPSPFSCRFGEKKEAESVSVVSSREAAQSSLSSFYSDYSHAAPVDMQDDSSGRCTAIEEDSLHDSDSMVDDMSESTTQAPRRKAARRKKQIHVKMCPDGSIDSRFRTLVSDVPSQHGDGRGGLLPCVSKKLLPRRAKKKGNGSLQKGSKGGKTQARGKFCYDSSGHKIKYGDMTQQQVVPKIVSPRLPQVKKILACKKSTTVLRQKYRRTTNKYRTVEDDDSMDSSPHASLPAINPSKNSIIQNSSVYNGPSYTVLAHEGVRTRQPVASLTPVPGASKHRAMYQAGGWESRSYDAAGGRGGGRINIQKTNQLSSENNPPRLVV
jgi:hypothetical protein